MKYFRVYKSGTKSVTIELEQKECDELVKHNSVMRFGCAQFVDGQCIYKGYLDDQEVETAKQKYGKG